jgi:uncharacterized damage-inducible protein DinB
VISAAGLGRLRKVGRDAALGGRWHTRLMDAETAALERFLDAQRTNVFEIVIGLSDEAAKRPMLPSGWTIAGLVQHLAYVERYWFRDIVAGDTCDYPWSEDDPDADWYVAGDVSFDSVLALYRTEIARSKSVLATVALDTPPARREERWEPEWAPDFRSVVLHMIEETARHAGHLDVVRELTDGKTGLGQS